MKGIALLVVLAAVLAPWIPTDQEIPGPQAWIEPSLEHRIRSAAPDEVLPVLLLLQEQAEWNTLQPSLAGMDRQARHEVVVRTLQETASRSQSALLMYLDQQAGAGRATRIESFWIANAIAVEVIPALVAELAQRPEVASIWENHSYALEPAEEVPSPLACPAGEGVEPGLLVMGADAMWQRGWNGEGILVATVDTGAQLEHAALQSRWRGNEPGVMPEEAWFDYWGASPTPADDAVHCGSHGTHVMGTILGDDGAHRVGIAPGAHWIAARIFGPPGSGCSSSDATKLAGWEWVADPDGDPGTVDDFPHVVNRSGGQFGTCLSPTAPLSVAIGNVIAAGAAVFFGAGNYGPEAQTIISWANQIQSPIVAFSVGNVFGHSDTLPIWNSSSRGPSPCDGITIKPEVVAPGVQICSSVIGGYGEKTGTSMSTPHVSGAAALLWQAFPELGPEAIQSALLYGAVDLGPQGEDNDYGMGLAHLPSAYSWLFDLTDSRLEIDPAVSWPDQRLSCTFSVQVGGLVTRTARLSSTVPAELALVPGSLWASSGNYGFHNGLITWTQSLRPDDRVTVTYAATLSAPLADGDRFTDTVLLDNGLTVLTRSAVVLVDLNPPSSFASSPAFAHTPFSVTFAASDTASGVAQTSLWARYESGSWAPTGQHLSGTAGVFPYGPAQGDGRYDFASQAVDRAGREEDAPQGDGDSTTLWDTQAPSSTAFSPASSPAPTFPVSWHGEDPSGGSGLAGYRIDVRPAEIGTTWTVWISDTLETSAPYTSAAGQATCFRSRARDTAGNQELPPADPWGDSCTMVSLRYEIYLPLLLREQ